MGSKSSSQPMYLPTVQSSNQSQSGSSSGTSTTSPDPLAALAYQQTLANAAQIAQTPYQPYEGQMIAGFTPDQIAAMEGIRQSQGIQNPYLQRSSGLYNQLTNTWQNPAMRQVENLYGTSLNYIPNQYMPAVQNYANTAANASANPLLGTAQRYGQQAAISSLNPYMGTAQNYLGESVDISDINKFNQGALSRYMSPYQQSVVDATLAQMKQNQDVLQNQNTANAIRQGAYGGSGQFMGQAELGRQQALSNAQTLAGLNQANYQQAMGQYNQQQQQAIQALQQAASTSGQLGQQQAALTAGTLSNVGQMLGQLGQQQSNLQAQTGLNLAQLYGDLGNQLAQRGIQSYQNAAQNLGQLGQQQQALGVQALGNAAQGVGNLGEQAQKANLTDLQALLSTGQLQQQLGQQQLTNAYNQWLQARAYPYQQTSYFGGLAGGLGPLLGQTGTTSTTSQSTSSGSGSGISPYQQQQSGGGTIPGLITSALGLFSALKDGGVVKERKAFADGGDAEEDESFGDLISKTPYSGSDLESPVTSKAGLGSLMSKQPYDAPSNYIGEASKLQKVIKPATSAARENVLGQINKLIDEIPTMKKFDMDMPEGNMPKFSKFGSGESEGDDWGGVLKSAGKLAKSEKFQNFASEGLGKLSSMFADGGEVNAAVSERPQHQYSQAQRAQNQANLILSNYQTQFGKAPSQGGFESLVEQTRGMQPAKIAEAVANYNAGAPSSSESMSNYDRLLQQAYARNPGPQLTPTQQLMPRMPSAQYYSQKYPAYEGTTGGNLNLARSMNLPEKYVEPTAEGASPFANFVNGVFQNYLGRRPTQDEMNWNLDVIKKGTKPADLENSIRNSSEATNTKFILDQYKDVLGHSATLDDLKYWKDQMEQGLSAKNVGILMRNHPDVLNLPEAFRGTAPVQGYFSELANTQFNPYTGLFNFKYKSPYRGTTVGDFLTKKDGGAIGKAAGGSLSGKDLYDYLVSLGANAKEASMLTGMAKTESSFNPYVMHDNNTGFGLWGHGKDRWADMQKFTGQHKPGWEEQAKFALWELRNSPKTALARQALNRAQDARDVAIAGMHFERPAGYRADAPWQGKNWQQRFANVSNLMSGKDIGSGMIGRVDSAPGSDASSFVRSQGIGIPSATPSRPNFLARLINALSPVGTAHAETAAPMTALPDWKQEVKTGFGPLQGEKPADAQQLLAAPTQHANMGPEMPSDNVVASDKKDGQKYWGDYRDVEGSSFGDLIDALAGDVKTSDKPGTRETPMGKYQGQGGLGGLFDFEGTNPYAPQKKTKEEESFDLGHLFDIFG